MVRVLHVIGSLNHGGSQALVLSLLEHMDRKKVMFDFIIDRADERQLEERVVKNGSVIYCLPLFTGRNCRQYIKAWDDFFCRHPEYHIIHGHVRSTASIYLGIARKHGLITIAHSHSTSSGSGLQAMIKNTMQYFIRYTADYFLSCSDEAGIWLFGRRAVRSDRYHLLTNGIDFDLYKPDALARLRLRKELGISESMVYGHVGRFNEAKNQVFLLKIFKEIQRTDPTAKLLLVGGFDDAEYPRAKEYAEANGLSESVVFYGSTDDVRSVLNAMDCFIFPSRWEGFGIAALEAQANGLPCFVSDAIPEGVKISDDLEFLDVNGSPRYWAERILESGKKRSEGAYDERYDIEKVGAWLEGFYLKLESMKK